MSVSDSPAALLVVNIEAADDKQVGESTTSLVFSVHNTGEQSVQWLIWNSPFETPMSANLFTVKSDGVVKDYQGRLIKRGEPGPEHYLTIAAGESIDTVIDIADYYDMATPGAYTVQLNGEKLSGVDQSDDTDMLRISSAALILTVH